MDSTGCPPTEIQFSHDDSQSFNGSYACSDMPTLSEDADCMDSLNGSLSPPSFDAQVHCLTDGEFATAGANNKFTSSDRFPVVGNEEENRSPGSYDVVGLNGTSPFELQGLQNTSVSSETENDSLSSSAAGKETSNGMELGAILTCSECDLYGELHSGIDELDKDLMGTSSVEDGWRSRKDSDLPGKNRKLPVFSWKDSAVDKSEIPSSISKPPISDITDLGDRFSHAANLNAEGLMSTAWDVQDDGKQNLALQDRFFAERVRVRDNTKGFFPRALLSSLVTEDCVFNELTRTPCDTHDPGQLRALAKNICEERSLPKKHDDNRPPKMKSFRKIFAILVLIEKTSSIEKFLEEDVNDLDLPLFKSPRLKNGSLFDLRRSRRRNDSLTCFKTWTQYQIVAFEEWQWSTVSPFFHKGLRKEVPHYSLQPSVVLPFIPFAESDARCKESNARPEIEGGYGCVFEVKIHPDHHDFDRSKTQSFAIKRLYSEKKEDFKKEVSMLKMFSDNAHPNLISLLATYEHLNYNYLLFPWADGDLTRFWKVHHPKPSFDQTTIKWVADQCKGIAHGLVKIHNYQTSNSVCPNGSHESRYGRHGDLKPENILWFKDANGGILKISDFGLSEYSTIHNRSKTNSSVAMSMSYRPPECDLKDGKVGQSYDIWTLGCLYLEFITWLLGGWNLVKEFEEKRMSLDPMWSNVKTDTFFELVAPQQPGAIATARVKPAVTDFIQQLQTHSVCTEFLHEFINMIRLDMMLVKSENPEERRWSSEQVYRRLDEMLKKCDADLDYMCKPAPWSSPSQNSNEMVKIGTKSAVILLRKTTRCCEGPIQDRLLPRMISVADRRPSFRH